MVAFIIIIYLVALGASAWAFMFMSDIIDNFIPLFTTTSAGLGVTPTSEMVDTINALIMLFRSSLIIIVILLSYFVWVKSQKTGAYR